VPETTRGEFEGRVVRECGKPLRSVVARLCAGALSVGPDVTAHPHATVGGGWGIRFRRSGRVFCVCDPKPRGGHVQVFVDGAARDDLAKAGFVSTGQGGRWVAVSSLGGAEQIVLLMRRACEAAAPIGKPNPSAAIPATVRTIDHLLPGVPTVNTITRPAALVRQGSLKLYATSLRVRDLKRHNFYAINKLDPDDSGPGYQRLLNEGRAKRLAEYLVDGHQEDDAFLPTSIFLATSGDIPFDAQANTITFDVSEIGPFNVVDGQHRIAGLVLASDKEPALLDFELPVNIAVCLDEISQMCHFLIVNTSQRPVDKSIEQQIVARLTKMIGLEKIPTIPRWIRRQVEKGEDARALSVATYLNQDSGSPWHGKIRMANDESEGATVNQKSFITSLKKYVFSANNPLSNPVWDGNRPLILANYWRAIVELLIDPDSEAPSVLYKTIGVDMNLPPPNRVYSPL
jgi:DGQHR domain-containing protein